MEKEIVPKSAPLFASENGEPDSQNGVPKKRGGGRPFPKGNNLGKRFGEGQSIKNNGRPIGGMSIMKQAMRLYEDNALSAAQYLILNALDTNMDPKAQFPWFKELNSRILGAAKGSAEDIVNQLSEKLDGVLSLSRPALEAAAMKDAEGLIRELKKQGILENVLEKINQEAE